MYSAKTYALYEKPDGSPTWQWQYQGRVIAAGTLVDRFGDHEPPWVRWVVRAKSPKQAKFFVYSSALSSQRDDGLGVYWDRREHGATSIAPLSKGPELWACVSECGGNRMASLFPNEEDAEAALEWLDNVCSQQGHRHFVIRTSLAEIKKAAPYEGSWWHDDGESYRRALQAWRERGVLR